MVEENGRALGRDQPAPTECSCPRGHRCDPPEGCRRSDEWRIGPGKVGLYRERGLVDLLQYLEYLSRNVQCLSEFAPSCGQLCIRSRDGTGG